MDMTMTFKFAVGPLKSSTAFNKPKFTNFVLI